jgi:hypothetical protein
VHLNPHQPKES